MWYALQSVHLRLRAAANARLPQLAALAALLILALPHATAQCTDIAGNWNASESGTVTLALNASDGESDNETDQVSGSGLVTITQTGPCTFQYTPIATSGSSLVNSGLTPSQLASLVRTVTVNGNNVTETGVFAILNLAAAQQQGLEITSVTGNVETGTGSVNTSVNPYGMTLNETANLVVTGTYEGYTFTLAISSSTTATLTAAAPISITVPSQTSIASGLAYNGWFTATGGSGAPYTWCVLSGAAGSACLSSASGSPLPDGFSLNATTGLLSSTESPAATQGSYPFTVQVTDSGGDTLPQDFTLVIGCPAIMATDASGKYIFATFTPPPTLNDPNPTLFDYASKCGFATFNWQQEWTALPTGSSLEPVLPSLVPDNVFPSTCSGIDSPQWPDSCYLVAGPSSLTGNALNYPDFNDPPVGGYVNPNAPSGYNPYPFYYPSSEIQPSITACTVPLNKNGVGGCPPFPYVVSQDMTILSFVDDPSIASLPGDSPSATPAPGHFVSFSTSLVGVSDEANPGGVICGPNSTSYCTILYSWTWNSTFNGTAGGVSQSASFSAIDPGSGTGGVTVTSINGVPTPTVTVTPSATNITTAQGLIVTVAVAGASGSPTATGSITLSSGSYTSAATALSSGSATISVPSGTLLLGSDTLTAVYTPDNASAATFSVSSGFAAVTVSAPLLAPTVTVTPSSTSILSTQTLSVTVSVAGGSGNPTPTGTVILSGGNYNSPIVSLTAGTVTIPIPANALSAGNDTLTADYSPDANSSSIYNSAAGSTVVTVSGITSGPGIQSVSNILPQQTQTITITGSGFGTQAAYNGDSAYIAIGDGSGVTWQAGYANSSVGIDDAVTLSISSWTDAQIILAGFTGAYGSGGWALSQGDLLSVSIWNAQTGAGPYTCSNIVVGAGPTSCGTIPVAVTPTVTVTPASTSTTAAQALAVTVVVSGGAGNPTPTGSVTLAGGGYTSSATTLKSGSASITIPAGALATGSDTLTASYTPDANSSSTYNSATGTSPPVTVTAAPAKPSFTVGGTAVTIDAGAATGNVSTITVTPAGGFTGSVALAAAITSSPAGALNLPTLSLGSSSPVSIVGTAPETAILTISTSAPTSAALSSPKRPGVPWYAAEGAALACVLLFGIPARRRRWRCTLGMLALLITVGSGILSCGGGGSSGGGSSGSTGGSGGTSNPGTTAGTYSVTVTGTSGATKATGTITLTVQ
jgi:hypothetical protein